MCSSDLGTQTRLTTNGDDRTYAFVRAKGTNTVVVAINFGDAPATLSYSQLTHTGKYTDWFSNARVTLAPTGTLSVPAHGYRVLVQ